MPRKFDATPYALKVISAVALLNESKEIDYVIDFLRGSDSEKVDAIHRTHEAFGIGTTTSRQDWLNLIRELISLGYLKRSPDKDAALVVSEKGKRVMSGNEMVMLAKSPFRINEKAVTISGKKKVPDFEPDLLLLLKDTRRYLASSREIEADDVIPYLKLHQMATYLPDNKDDLQRIAGWDDAQLKSYGAAFLKVIIEYLEVNSLQSRMSLYRK